MENKKVRVRFAPSPTGALHIGGVRTALYNYLFAKKYGGDFLLRIEDTDQTRYVAGAEEYIVESLKWCGIQVDEGVTVGGNFAPYRQSERKPIYRQYAEQLVASGNAYYAFDTPEELQAMRERLQAQKSDNQQYNALSRKQMTNSFTLSAAEIQARIESGENYVIRFNMPKNETLVVKDLIRGEVKFQTAKLDDKVLFKSDGMPTYHLANVVDDHLMQISHVIRGEEWLPSLPLHVLLYRSFAWQETMPQFAHLSLLLKPNGKGKLSKRDGDKLGFPVFPLEWKDPKTGEISSGYRESGYFADAFVNMLAFLGWNPGTEQEIFSLTELVEAFSLDKVGKSGSKFSPDKTKWFNQQYLRNKSNQELAQLLDNQLKAKGITAAPDYLSTVCGMLKERATFVSDLWDLGSFFFQKPTNYDAKTVKKRWKAQTPELMIAWRETLATIDEFSAANIKSALEGFVAEKGVGFGQLMMPFRICLVGSGSGPDLFEIAAMLGKQEVKERIDKAVENL